MGIYLNPGNEKFEAMRRDLYVDKTGLIACMNDQIGKPKPLICFSRPRRFGKSFDANMLCAYYDRSCDSGKLFEDLKIAGYDSFKEHLNQYNVISFDVTGFIGDSGEHETSIVEEIKNALLKELKFFFRIALMTGKRIWGRHFMPSYQGEMQSLFLLLMNGMRCFGNGKTINRFSAIMFCFCAAFLKIRI